MMAESSARGAASKNTKTYENPQTGQKEKLDPADPATQARVASGELRESAE
jgi:hypothetical protein